MSYIDPYETFMLSSDFIGQLIAFYVDSPKEAKRPLKDIYISLSLLHLTQKKRESWR